MTKLFLLSAALLLSSPLTAAEPVMDVYVSTGDNHFLGSSLPIDSPASIEATFDLFQKVNHAQRVYWRGLEAACWLATMNARPENVRYHSFWLWLQELSRTVQPDVLAVKAAHARGMECWGMGSLFDWGSPPDTPGFNDYPFTFECRLKVEHQEWAPQNKYGTRSQGGPIELAYPAARKAMVDVIVKETLAAGYDGISLLTYAENYALRYQDEFGYSDPIVEDFKKAYKLDLRSESFRRGASREDWLRLRGSYITAFLRELKAALSQHKIKLGMVVNSNDPRQPQSWNVPELMLAAGSHHMDVDAWVREGIVDELAVWGNNSGQSQMQALDDLTWLARGTQTTISVITSGPFRESFKPYQDKGVRTLLSVNDDDQHLSRGFIAEQKDLASKDVHERMRAITQSIEGQLKLDASAILPSLKSANLIERRLALKALGKLPEAPLAALTDALADAENGVRCQAALALASRADPAACAALLTAVEKHGNHMLRECIVIALRRLKPLPVPELQQALTSKHPHVREVAIRALQHQAFASLLPDFQKALHDEHPFVRFVAAEALGGYVRSDEAVKTLIAALNHTDPAVKTRAATSLGVIAKAAKAELAALRPQMIAALKTAFVSAADDGWSFRVIGNAMLDFGPEGLAALHDLRDHAPEHRIAENAWRVADLTQRTASFSEVSAQEDAAAHQQRPKAPAPRDLKVGIDEAYPTIAHAIKAAQPGDTIHLENKVYRDYAGFYGKKGQPGRPITLDGHGAILEGSDPLKPEQWKEVSPGLFAAEELLPRLDTAMLSRWFFLFAGKMQLMGSTSKGTQTPHKKPEELKPGEWTFVQGPARPEAKVGQIFGTFFIKLAPGKKLTEADIAVPVRSAGVQFSGDNAHLVIKNLTATHPYNDGFNIHGDCRDVRFENIRAIECGDDGISAHESAQYAVDGFISIGNSTGICDTGTARTSYRRVFIADCLGHDLYFLDDGRYSLSDAIVLSSAQNPFVVTSRADQRCELKIENLHFRRLGPAKPALIAATASVHARRLTMEDIAWDKRGELKSEGAADLAAIMHGFGAEMRTAVLAKHSSYLLSRAVTRDGKAPVPVFTAPDHCAWPNLKLLRDGKTLAAFIFNNASHGHRPGDVECWLSDDGGTQWRLASACTQHEEQTIRMNHAAGLARSGDLLVLTAGWSNLWPPGVPKTRGSFRYDVLSPWLSRSTDGGKTWTVSKDAVPTKTPGGQPGTPFGDVVTAQNGDLCVSIYSTLDPLDKYEDRRFCAWLYRSKDDGKTWGEPVVIGPAHNETNILHLGGGRWLACARGGTGVEGRDFVDLFTSSDDGCTWTKKRQLSGFQRVNGHLLRLKDGRVLFSYGDRAAAHGKRGLEAMLSADHGETWSDPIRLMDWNGLDGGYPSCVQRGDGQIVTAYYSSALDNEPATSTKGYHMSVIVWDVERSFGGGEEGRPSR